MRPRRTLFGAALVAIVLVSAYLALGPMRVHHLDRIPSSSSPDALVHEYFDAVNARDCATAHSIELPGLTSMDVAELCPGFGTTLTVTNLGIVASHIAPIFPDSSWHAYRYAYMVDTSYTVHQHLTGWTDGPTDLQFLFVRNTTTQPWKLFCSGNALA